MSKLGRTCCREILPACCTLPASQSPWAAAESGLPGLRMISFARASNGPTLKPGSMKLAASGSSTQCNWSIVVGDLGNGPTWIGGLGAHLGVPENAIEQVFRALVGLVQRQPGRG